LREYMCLFDSLATDSAAKLSGMFLILLNIPDFKKAESKSAI